MVSPPVTHGWATGRTVHSISPNAMLKPHPPSQRTDATIALVQCAGLAGPSEAAIAL